MIQFRCDLCKNICGDESTSGQLVDVDLEKSIFIFGEQKMPEEYIYIDDDYITLVNSNLYMCPHCYERTINLIYNSVADKHQAIKQYKKFYKSISVDELSNELPEEEINDDDGLESLYDIKMAELNEITARNKQLAAQAYKWNIPDENPIIINNEPADCELHLPLNKLCLTDTITISSLNIKSKPIITVNGYSMYYKQSNYESINNTLSELMRILYKITMTLIDQKLFDPGDYKLYPIHKEPKILYKEKYYKIYWTDHDKSSIHILIQYINEIIAQLGEKNINISSDTMHSYESYDDWVYIVRYTATKIKNLLLITQ